VLECELRRSVKHDSSGSVVGDLRRAGGDEFGRSSAARRRVNRQRSPSLQAQGSDGRHHQGSEAPLLLPEAGREAASEASVGAKACSEEDSQRVGLSCNQWPQLERERSDSNVRKRMENTPTDKSRDQDQAKGAVDQVQNNHGGNTSMIGQLDHRDEDVESGWALGMD